MVLSMGVRGAYLDFRGDYDQLLLLALVMGHGLQDRQATKSA